jgi:hypothetical protein
MSGLTHATDNDMTTAGQHQAQRSTILATIKLVRQGAEGISLLQEGFLNGICQFIFSGVLEELLTFLNVLAVCVHGVAPLLIWIRSLA